MELNLHRMAWHGMACSAETELVESLLSDYGSKRMNT